MKTRFASFLFALASLAACSAESLHPDDASVVQSDASAQSEASAPSTDAASDAGIDSAVSSDFVDPRDGQRYPVLQLGGKTWLARNLNFDIAGSSFCYGDDTANCDKDGRLYLWSGAKTACPMGFHLGSDEEWKSLEAAIGMAADQLNVEGYDTARGKDEGTILKSEAGFGARMAGYRSGKTYDALGDRTYFWTSTTRGTDVWRRRIAAATSNVFRFTNPPSSFAISVRCVVE